MYTGENTTAVTAEMDLRIHVKVEVTADGDVCITPADRSSYVVQVTGEDPEYGKNIAVLQPNRTQGAPELIRRVNDVSDKVSARMFAAVAEAQRELSA